MAEGRVSADVSFTTGASLAFGSVGSSYTGLRNYLSFGRIAILIIQNSLDQRVWLSLDAGTTDWGILEPGQGIALDLGANGMLYCGYPMVKYVSVAPTSGAINCMAIRAGK